MARRDYIEAVRVYNAELKTFPGAGGTRPSTARKPMAEFAAVDDVYGEFFEEPYPARSTVEVARLPKDLHVEIEAVAYRG